MKSSEKNPAAHDVVSLKKMTVIERKTHEMAQIKKSFDAAIERGALRSAIVSQRAIELFEGDSDMAEKWLVGSNRALEWKSPADMLSHPSGIDEVLRLITRIEQGIYS
ncbi:MbcA/ParS/Xre antitoxin family protein [Pectobacterium brasiliense]|uniref:MbcA/ParS/Xre antitoxin family protein n=1 Tax=Pectobacterium brasiliense TaxID=180957 RepID=UPI00069C715F|nr:MbcA/ParS/Xre antitoxin family protein [Pectobacterium brasiliense]MBN3182555.1 DUF2384 domain-containing protein [Pectobacterium brasiliense]MCG5048034.1 MbcA/ParS/Xre antitoxin family protein [Pectobacterium brasiliense]PPE64788.1 hypothetical protein F152LOC_00253 [Pectobacterium brasiliense]